MAIDPLGLGGTATASSANSTSLNKLSSDYQSFLKLLTAQISNQDPLEPMDSTTFVTQLAQLSQVEQSVQVNTNLDSISAQLAGVGALAGLSFIGKTVVAPSDQITTTGEGGPMFYRLAAPANSVTMTIRAEDGSILRVLKDLPAADGKLNEVQWDGADLNGTRMPAGTYTVSLEALDDAGNTIASQTYGKSAVKRMSFADGLATLELANGSSVSAGMVETIE